MESLKKQINDLEGERNQLKAKPQGLSVKQLMIDSISTIPYYNKDVNSGSMNKFKRFVQDLFTSGLSNDDI